MPSVKKGKKTNTKARRKIVFVTGLSGAGISSALKIFEDMGYEVFDNIPLDFVAPLVAQKGYENAPIALGLDTRARGFSPKSVVSAAKKHAALLVFIGAGNMILQKRFSETRRGHPLAKDRPVLDGIRQERNLLKPLMDAADLLVDTSDLSIHDLRRTLEASVHPDEDKRRLAVTVMSFGFKNGVPRESDMVLDVRFLRNPHWIQALKEKTGLEKAVTGYVTADPDFAGFISNSEALLNLLLPRYSQEGKFYFTLAVGCTGGRHRSVCVAEKLARKIKSLGHPVSIRHRDIDQ